MILLDDSLWLERGDEPTEAIPPRPDENCLGAGRTIFPCDKEFAFCCSILVEFSNVSIPSSMDSFG